MGTERVRALLVWPLATAGVVGGLTAMGATSAGRPISTSVLDFLEYYSGVFALVGLSVTVMMGLLVTDRILLSVPHRITGQVLHRAIALVALTFLCTHITLKIIEGHANPAESFAPLLAGRAFYVGLGTLASDLFILVTATGIVRGRFAGPRDGAPMAWRALHATAYVAWPLAIAHGLAAGRQPATWVVWSYRACLIGVGFAVLTRLVTAVRTRRAIHRTGRRDRLPMPGHAQPVRTGQRLP